MRIQSFIGRGSILHRIEVGHQTTARLLVLELGIRVYRLEKRRLPESLDQLVPEIVPDVQIDPYSGKPLKYVRSGTEHRLYSVGPDRRDNGGKTIHRELYVERKDKSGLDLDIYTMLYDK